MYKTVRHGENSLQYTILPQTEEVLNNSGLKGKGRDYSPSIHIRRSKRRSALKYLLVIILGIIIAFAFASVPLYALNGALAARRVHRDHHDTASGPSFNPGREIIRSRKKELKMIPDVATTLKATIEPSVSPTFPTSTSTTKPTTVAIEKPTHPPWIMPSLRSWKTTTSSTTTRPPTTEGNEKVRTTASTVPLLDHYMSIKPWENDIIIRATATPEPMTIRNVFKYYSASYKPSQKLTTTSRDSEDVLITTKGTTLDRFVTFVPTQNTKTNEVSKLKDLKDTILSVDDDDEFKEALEVDEVFSLPPIKPETGILDTDEVTVSKTTDNGWYGARWPFVDTSSYFQWTGYSPGDNWLLPLLVGALCSIGIVLLLTLVLKKRKRTCNASAQIGVSADLHEDDNTNLLTSENVEEVEE